MLAIDLLLWLVIIFWMLNLLSFSISCIYPSHKFFLHSFFIDPSTITIPTSNSFSNLSTISLSSRIQKNIARKQLQSITPAQYLFPPFPPRRKYWSIVWSSTVVMMAINAIIMKIFSIIDFCYRFSNLTKLLFIPSSSCSVRWFISFCLLDFYLFWEFCFNFLSKTHPPVYPTIAPLPKNFCRPCPFGIRVFC